jgi:hypothetical protein
LLFHVSFLFYFSSWLFSLRRRRIDKGAFTDYPQKLFGRQNRQPFVVIPSMQHYRDFLAGIAFGLGDPIVGVALLATLHFKMDSRQRLANNVGRICATAELLPATSREAFAREKLGGLQLSALAFVSASS